MASRDCVVQSWVRSKEDICEDLATVVSEFDYLIPKVPTMCEGRQSICIRVHCDGHRECWGRYNAKEHPSNCPLRGQRNTNEPSETKYCRSAINGKEINLLSLAQKKVRSICDPIGTSSSSILLVVKLEAVLKAVLHVSKVFFPLSANTGTATETNQFLLLAQKPAVCKKTLPREVFLRNNYTKACHHPLVDVSLRSSFVNILQKLIAAMDSLHMEQVLMNLFSLPAVYPRVEDKEEPDNFKQELCMDDSLVVIQEVAHGEDEPVAFRDEELLHEQAEHDWADCVVDRVLHGGVTQEDANETEQIFLYPYSRAPAEFKEVLLEGKELGPTRELMRAKGCDFVLEPSGAKVFVWPEQYPAVLDALRSLEMSLRTSHVIIAESLLPALEASIGAIAHKKNVRPKKSSVMTLVSIGKTVSTSSSSDGYCEAKAASGTDETEAEQWDILFKVEGTFLTFAKAPRNSGSVNQSTTEAHGGSNPRRKRGGGLDLP
eukprot:TRINITY_DN53313_c0_g1_i1.p1 TRINITY_DN53313_c0_g1~~TRINITY_DN53313_c0_g1_i1.p1  ORF type:complete len:510 (-),score=81.57 TRINITY_DN53313_c0_g1_i1:250-1716(-)